MFVYDLHRATAALPDIVDHWWEAVTPHHHVCPANHGHQIWGGGIVVFWYSHECMHNLLLQVPPAAECKMCAQEAMASLLPPSSSHQQEKRSGEAPQEGSWGEACPGLPLLCTWIGSSEGACCLCVLAEPRMAAIELEKFSALLLPRPHWSCGRPWGEGGHISAEVEDVATH